MDTIVKAKYCDDKSILVINSIGKLRRLYLPFRVSGKELRNGKRYWYIVDAVMNTHADELVYIINGKPYFHHHFLIEINF